MNKILLFLIFVAFISNNVFSLNLTNEVKAVPEVEVRIDTITKTQITASFTPNSTCAKYVFLIGVQSEMEQWSVTMGKTIPELIVMWGIQKTTQYTHSFTELTPATEYTIFVLLYNEQNEEFPYTTKLVSTAINGGTGLSEIALSVDNITENSVKLIARPNQNTAVFVDGLVKLSLFNEIGEDSAVNIIKANTYLLYQDDEWVWQRLLPNTSYKAIAIGKNLNNEWGNVSIIEFSTLSSFIDNAELEKTLIYPQPNNGCFTLKLENDNTFNSLKIIDLSGRIIIEQSISNNNTDFNLSFLDSGIYYLLLVDKQLNKQKVEKLLIAR